MILISSLRDKGWHWCPPQMHHWQLLLFHVFMFDINLNPSDFGWMLWKGMNSFRTFPFNHFSTMAAFMTIICFYVHKRITIQRLKMIRLLMRTVLTKSFFVHLVTFWRLFTCDQAKWIINKFIQSLKSIHILCT